MMIAPTASAAPDLCANSASTSPGSNQEATRRPVVLVHGWTGGPLKQTADLLQQQLGMRISTFTFDYSQSSADWAADPHIALCLATYVNQVSAAHQKAGGDGKIIAVAHSMGGLAMRYATRLDTNPVTASTAPWVITLGTPSLGSPWGGPTFAKGWETLRHVFGAAMPPPDADGGLCLAPHTRGAALPATCGPLPPWLPSGVRLTQIAGDVTVNRSLFGVSLYSIPLASDGVVPIASAHGYPTSGPGGTPPAQGATAASMTDSCQVDFNRIVPAAMQLLAAPSTALQLPHELALDYLTLRDLQADQFSPDVMLYLAGVTIIGSCSHLKLATDSRAISQVVAEIRAALAAAPPRAALDVHKADLSSIPVPAALCGTNNDFVLRRGSATGLASSYGTLDAGTTGKVVFGDLDGDGRDEVATDVYCNYQGGNGVPAQGFVILSGATGTMTPVGVVTARYQPPQVWHSAVETLTIALGHITATEDWYHPDDPDCCPSGRARTVWTYTNRHLLPGTPQLTG